MPVQQSLEAAQLARTTPEIPELKRHKGTGQAYILSGRKRTYFGRHSLPETHRKYHAFCAELLASGGVALQKGPGATVERLCAGYLEHARRTYVRPDGSPSGEARNYESALGLLVELYGPIPCDEFSPRCLRAVRQGMIERGWSRRSVNRQVVRVRTVFKWGVSEGIVDPSTLASLQCLAGLRAGQGGVRESEPVRALREHQIEPVIAAAPPVVADMIRVQLLTAMRPGEVCAMRPIDLDTSGELWIYTPERHKNQHRGQGRIVVVGPQAQRLLEPYLPGRPVQLPVFSPVESEGRRRGGSASAGPRSRLREAYDTVSYARAVRRACERAFPVPEDLARIEGEARRWRDEHRWTPNQLRHTAATRIRSVAGLEMSRIALGHSTASVTEQFYAEADTDKLRGDAADRVTPVRRARRERFRKKRRARMGGLGSGRPRKNPASYLVEECLAIDVNAFNRGEVPAARLAHDHRGRACVLEPRGLAGPRERIELTQSGAGFGGVRWWFRCPRCGGRRGKLYRPPGASRHLCRVCHGLAYRSQREHDTRVDELAENPELMAELLGAYEGRLCLGNAHQASLLAIRCIRACRRKIAEIRIDDRS